MFLLEKVWRSTNYREHGDTYWHVSNLFIQSNCKCNLERQSIASQLNMQKCEICPQARIQLYIFTVKCLRIIMNSSLLGFSFMDFFPLYFQSCRLDIWDLESQKWELVTWHLRQKAEDLLTHKYFKNTVLCIVVPVGALPNCHEYGIT